VSCSFRNALRLTELSAERCLTRLIGRTDIEDALKRLDKLTNDEARMATAQILKATRNIDNNVDQVKCSSFLNLIRADTPA
jgi:ribosome recycling factor